MLLKDTKLKVLVDDTWTDVENLTSLDIIKTNVPCRRDEERTGTFINQSIDHIEFNFERYHNDILDSAKEQDELSFKVYEGSASNATQYKIFRKINKKIQKDGEDYYNTYMVITPIEDAIITLSGDSSGGVSQEYVDEQDQAVKSYADKQLDAAKTEVSENFIGKTQIDNDTIYWEDGVLKAKGIDVKALRYKGLLDSESSLPTEGVQGDTYFVKTSTYATDKNCYLYCWVSDSDKWQIVGSTKVDLTGYQKKLTPGANIIITEDNVISATGELASAKWGGITGTLSDQTDLSTALENKLDKVSYIELAGTKGTLTDEQRATLLSGSPTLNFIDKDGMIFKCVFYSAGKKAVYSIAGESKIHVITVTLPAGTWALVTYNLSEGVSQDYVDKQDAATLTSAETYAVEQDKTVTSNLSTLIQEETTSRENAVKTVQSNIDAEATTRGNADTSLQANIEEEAATRQAVDEKLLTAVNNKQDILTAGTNITIVDNVISASGGGSATSFISLSGTSGTVTTDQLKVLGANFANYILVIGTDDTTRRFTFVQEPFPSMDLHYVCINQNKVDLLTITQGNNKWSITDGSELAKQSDLEAVDAKLGEDENGIYVDL